MALVTKFLSKISAVWILFSLGIAGGAARSIGEGILKRHVENLQRRQPYFPAIFSFGDSTLDIGNNNLLASPRPTKVNFYPYGIDYIPARGSYTNGKGFMDFFGGYLGLPPVQKHSDLNSGNAKIFKSGINFASGGSGVLPGTNCNNGEYCTYLTTQVQQFASASSIYSPEVIAESLVVMSVGSNDYFQLFRDSSAFDATAYLTSVVTGIGAAVQSLYAAGLRKFIIFEVGSLGCTPALLGADGKCVDGANRIVAAHNFALAQLLVNLRVALPEASILEGLLTGFFTNVTANPSSFGLVNTKAACCGGSNTEIWCGDSNANLCPNRNDYLFWDFVHVTEVAWKAIAHNVFLGNPAYVSPAGPKDISAVQHISTH